MTDHLAKPRFEVTFLRMTSRGVRTGRRVFACRDCARAYASICEFRGARVGKYRGG